MAGYWTCGEKWKLHVRIMLWSWARQCTPETCYCNWFFQNYEAAILAFEECCLKRFSGFVKYKLLMHEELRFCCSHDCYIEENSIKFTEVGKEIMIQQKPVPCQQVYKDCSTVPDYEQCRNIITVSTNPKMTPYGSIMPSTDRNRNTCGCLAES